VKPTNFCGFPDSIRIELRVVVLNRVGHRETHTFQGDNLCSKVPETTGGGLLLLRILLLLLLRVALLLLLRVALLLLRVRRLLLAVSLLGRRGAVVVWKGRIHRQTGRKEGRRGSELEMNELGGGGPPFHPPC